MVKATGGNFFCVNLETKKIVVKDESIAVVRKGKLLAPVSSIIGYSIMAEMPNVGSPAPKRKMKATRKPAAEPAVFAFLS